jgi:uncharacterized membrane protein YfcA
MEFGWRVVVGSLIGFFGAACGSVGGVGGGGIFVPMLALIIGFDPKSSTAISKCEYYCFYIYSTAIYVYLNLNEKAQVCWFCSKLRACWMKKHLVIVFCI